MSKAEGEVLEAIARSKERVSRAIDSLLALPSKIDELINAINSLKDYLEKTLAKPVPPTPPKAKPPTIPRPPRPPIPTPTRPEVTEEVVTPEVFVRQPVTRIWTRYNLKTAGYYEVANFEGVGEVREAVIVAKSPEYEIHFKIDDRTYVYDFLQLTKMQKYIEFLDAIVTVDGYYLFKLYHAKFNSQFVLAVNSDVEVEYMYIFVLYDMYL